MPKTLRNILLGGMGALLAVCLSLGAAGIVPAFTARAAEGAPIEVQFDSQTTTYDTFESAIDFIQDLETSEENRVQIRLLDDVTIGDEDRFYNMSSLTYAVLDLNGHILRGNGTSSVISHYSDLIVEDSQSGSTAEEHQHDYYVEEGGMWIVDDGSEEWQSAYAAAEKKGTITGGVITGGNNPQYGGGIYIHNNGTLTINGGSIVGNTAGWGGGGVFASGNAVFVMNGGMIAGNTATGGSLDLGYGGGVLINNTQYGTMNGGLITENVANIGGGLTAAYYGFTITGGEICRNYAAQTGGIYVATTLQFKGGKIYDNVTDTYGGGILATTLEMSGGEVYGNEAAGGTAIYAAAIDVSGGKVNGTIVLEQEVYSITGGYFAEGVEYGTGENANTVCGLPVAEGYVVIDRGEEASDGYPYMVCPVGVGDDITVDAAVGYPVYDGKPVEEGADFVLTVLAAGEPADSGKIAYSYSENGGAFVSGLPQDVGEYTVKATVGAFVAGGTFYTGTEYRFRLNISAAKLTVAGISVDVGQNGSASVNSFTVAGICENDDVRVEVVDCTRLADGRVHITYALAGGDAGNYAAPEDTYTFINSSGLEEVEAAIDALRGALASLQEDVGSLEDDTQEQIDAAVEDIEGNAADIADLAAQLQAAQDAVAALDETYATDEELAAAVADLEEAIASARTALQTAIDGVQAELDAAVEDLQAAIDGSAADLSAQLAALQEAYEAADALLAADIDALQGADGDLAARIDALESAHTAADDAIRAAVEQLQAAVDDNEASIGTLTALLWVFAAVSLVALGVGGAGLAFALKNRKN